MPKKQETATYKHLSMDERYTIQSLLNQHKSIRYIAAQIGKNPSTVLREIRNHRQKSPKHQNDCILRSDCIKRNVCGKIGCKKKCSSAACCNRICPDYQKQVCSHLQKSPYVCNGCNKTYICSFERYYYKAANAENTYRTQLTNSRNGFDLTLEQILTIDDTVSPLIMKGLSPYHIKQTLGSQLSISESTLRRLIANNDLTARNIDLRSQVKYRQRKHHQLHNEIPLASKMGHMYKDYLKYIEEKACMVAQMDCVEGKQTDHAVLLTLHFPVCHMQLAFIMEEHTSSCVVSTLDKIEEALSPELFSATFPIILTDNGHEFSDIAGMERSINGGQRTKVFFCEPNRADEKGSCENNHKLIRYVIPKGRSLEPYNQAQISHMMNHINSYSRKKLLGQTPYAVARNILSPDFFICLGLETIPPEKVNLTPSLLALQQNPSK